ncbi:hypothetical protein ACFWD7_06375 [Streptomyces mirabilis]|uniref:hypothetical protein n=1 Tax=Streptomyces mirabilis TaxID=68239 RepID=UPI0036904647
MSEIADFLRTILGQDKARQQDIWEQWHHKDCEAVPQVLYPDRETGSCDCGVPERVIADCDAKLALINEIEPPDEPAPADSTAPWCCDGRAFYCPLCTEPRIGVGDCPGHPDDEASRELVRTDRLHAERRHPAYEYATTEGQRKQWDDADVPPRDDNGEPEPGWEPNTHSGCTDAWERFDYTEESYWRRLRADRPRVPYIPRALRILAQPFAGQPGHKGEEWAP